jgi:hypothetical protein
VQTIDIFEFLLALQQNTPEPDLQQVKMPSHTASSHIHLPQVKQPMPNHTLPSEQMCLQKTPSIGLQEIK